MSKFGKWLLVASLSVVALVFLITQSVWMDAFKDMPVSTKQEDRAVVSLVFAILLVLSVVAFLVLEFTNVLDGKNKRWFKLGAVVLAVLMLVLTFAITIDNQSDYHTFAKYVNGAKHDVFAANVAFFVIGFAGIATGEVLVQLNK